MAALQHDLLHVVDEITQVERLKIVRAADPRNFDRVIDHPRRAERIERRRDDAGLCRQLAQLLRQPRLTHDQAVDVLLDGPPRHVRLLADDDDRLGPREQQIRVRLRQRDRYLAADAVDGITRLVDDLPVEHAQQVEHWDVLHAGRADGLHVVGRDLRRGEHAIERPVVVDDRDGRDGPVGLQRVPRAAQRHGAAQRGRRVVIEVAHLRAHGLDAHRRLKAEPVEDQLRLVRDVAEARGDIVALADGVLQRGIGHRGNDGVGIRVAVAGDVDGIHNSLLTARSGRPRPWSAE